MVAQHRADIKPPAASITHGVAVRRPVGMARRSRGGRGARPRRFVGVIKSTCNSVRALRGRLRALPPASPTRLRQAPKPHQAPASPQAPPSAGKPLLARLASLGRLASCQALQGWQALACLQGSPGCAATAVRAALSRIPTDILVCVYLCQARHLLLGNSSLLLHNHSKSSQPCPRVDTLASQQ
jgi:hypothetical protein